MLAVIILCGWFALIGQFYLNVKNDTVTLAETILRFFSYFTIDSNLLVTVCAMFLLFGSKSRLGSFFSRESVQTALAVYIFVVGLIYNAILRFIWNPEGIQRVVNESFHVAVPVLFILFWGIYCTKRRLPWKKVFPWMIYPLIYTAFIFICGSCISFYPYPFVDVIKIGVPSTVINCLGVTLVFVLSSLAFIGIGNWIVKRRMATRN